MLIKYVSIFGLFSFKYFYLVVILRIDKVPEGLIIKGYVGIIMRGGELMRGGVEQGAGDGDSL